MSNNIEDYTIEAILEQAKAEQQNRETDPKRLSDLLCKMVDMNVALSAERDQAAAQARRWKEEYASEVFKHVQLHNRVYSGEFGEMPEGSIYSPESVVVASIGVIESEMGNLIPTDDLAIDRFAAAMKAKMAAAREKGRSGWDNRKACSGEMLAGELVAHLSKNNPGTFEDVANFSMMLHQRNESPALLLDAVNSLKASFGKELCNVLSEAAENAAVNEYDEESAVMGEAWDLLNTEIEKLSAAKDGE